MQKLDDLLAYPLQVGAQLDQHLRGHAVTLADAGGTHGARNPAPSGIGWRDVTPAGTVGIRVIAGERPIGPGNEKRPQQDSNLRTRLRRALTKMPLTSTDTQGQLLQGAVGARDPPGGG